MWNYYSQTIFKLFFKVILEFNSIVIMRRINFNKRPTPVARDPPEPHAKIPLNACSDWCRLCLFPLVSPTWLCSESVVMPLSLQSLCHALSSGVSHNATARMAASSTSVHFWQPDLAFQYHPWPKVEILRGQPLLPHSMDRAQGWGHLRATPEFGVFWFIPPLLSKPIFGQPPL